MATLFAFLHHLMAFTMVAALAIEFVLIRQEITRVNALRLLVADAVLAASATVLLIVGLLRVFYFEKGAAYYFSSHAFLTKLAVFILVAIMSAVPTIEFLSWRKAVRAGQAPAVSDKKLKTVRSILHYELIGIVVILAAAALMAKGGGVDAFATSIRPHPEERPKDASRRARATRIGIGASWFETLGLTASLLTMRMKV